MFPRGKSLRETSEIDRGQDDIILQIRAFFNSSDQPDPSKRCKMSRLDEQLEHTSFSSNSTPTEQQNALNASRSNEAHVRT